MIRALSAGDLDGVAARLCNVFEEFLPEEYHEVFHIKNRLLELGALNAAMSGSGPTVFGIFREETGSVWIPVCITAVRSHRIMIPCLRN